MEQINGLGLSMLQAVAAQTGTVKTAGKTEDGDFQKLLERAKSEQSGGQTEEPVKAEKPAAGKKEAPQQEKAEDPVETVKKMQVYLTPVSPEVLSQYPPEWIPQVEEGEAIVCIGVQTGENGENIPILVGANEANQRLGMQTAAPEIPVQTLPQEETAPVEEPVWQPEEQAEQPAVTEERLPEARTTEVRSEEQPRIQPQEKDEGEMKVEVTDAEQAPRQVFQDLKAVPVKVGDAPELSESREPDIAGQIERQLTQALQTGESQVRIQLTPESLGTITVEISHSAEGILHVALSAHSSETRGLLERHASDLQGLLAGRTQENVQVEVQRQQESQQNQNQHPYDGRNGQDQSGQQQEHQQRRQQEKHSQDFVQQLRLGLIPQNTENI